MGSEKKLILIILFLLILIFILIFVVINPILYEVKNLAESIEQEQAELENLYQKGKTLTQLKDELKKIEEEKYLLDGVFLLEKKELEFITVLEKIAAKNNVLQDVFLEERRPFQDDYKSMPVSLSLRSGFSDLIRYLRELEKLDFYFNIKSLEIAALPGKDNQLGIGIKANTYWKQK